MDKNTKKKVAFMMVAVYLVAAACPLLAIGSDVVADDDLNPELTKFFKDIKYDPDKAIVATPGKSGIVPNPSTETDSGKTKTVTIKYRKNTITSDAEPVLYNIGYQNDVVYPGSILVGNTNLANGTPDKIAADRSDVRLSLSLYSGGSFTANPGNYGDYKKVVDAKLDEWSKTGTPIAPILDSVKYDAVYTEDQASIALKVSGKYIKDLNIQYGKAAKTSTVVLKYTQIFYTVSADKKEYAGNYFTNNVKIDTLRTQLTDKDGKLSPAVFTTNAAYGRMILVSATAEADAEELKIVIDAVLKGKKADLNVKQKKISENMTLNAVVVGGQAVGKKPVKNFDDVNALLNEKITLDDYKAAVLLNAQTVFLDNGRLAKTMNTAEFVEKTINETSSINVTFDQNGLYVAKYLVFWKSFSGIDKDGKFTGVKNEESTAGKYGKGGHSTISIASNHLESFKMSLWAVMSTKVMKQVVIPTPQEKIDIHMKGWWWGVKYCVKVDGKKVAGNCDV